MTPSVAWEMASINPVIWKLRDDWSGEFVATVHREVATGLWRFDVGDVHGYDTSAPTAKKAAVNAYVTQLC